MRRITKSMMPESLELFNKTSHADWSDIHQPNNKKVYEDCLDRCIMDQNNLCGYTEIALTPDTRHIDHYIKRDFDPRLTFDWTNMIAAVKDSRFGADWKDNQIKKKDYDKNLHRYRNILNPIENEMNGRFTFFTDGTIEPSDSNDSTAANTIKIFNLNESSLKSRRRDIMQDVRNMAEGGIDKDSILSYLKEDGFISAIEYELSLI